MVSRIATAEDAGRFMKDLELLLIRRYPTRKAVAATMAIELKKNPHTYYTNFIHYIRGTKNISNGFLQDFYKIFQSDLETIKGEVTPSAQGSSQEKKQEETGPSPLSETREEPIQFLKKMREDLVGNLGRVIESNYRVIESNYILVLNNQKLVEAHLLLITKLTGTIEEKAREEK